MTRASCVSALEMMNGFMRWYKYADLWKVDEVKSLENLNKYFASFVEGAV